MSISKRLEEARRAWAERSTVKSAAAHDPARIAAATEEHGGASSQYLGEMVYGGLDGIVTTFAVVSGVAGAALGSHVVLIMGLANLLADGFSMAVGSYLSAKSEKEYYRREREREAWEVENFPEGEKAELYEIYRQRGYSEEDARHMVEIQTRTPQRWVEAMMRDELELQEETRNPLMMAGATFLAFAIAGSVPLIIYLLGLTFPIDPAVSFPISLTLSGVALFGLGAAKVIVTQRNAWVSGLEMLVVGGLAAAVAYVVGVLLKGIGG